MEISPRAYSDQELLAPHRNQGGVVRLGTRWYTRECDVGSKEEGMP